MTTEFILDREIGAGNDFSELVSADIKNTLDEESKAFLRQTENLIRFRDTLISIMVQIDSQLAAKKAQYLAELAKFNNGAVSKTEWVNYKAASARSRSGSIRFKQAALERLLEVRALMRERNEESTARTLRNAIYAHASHSCGPECDDTCTADEKLWALLKS